MNQLLQQLSSLSTFAIVTALGIHLFIFFALWLWSRRDLKNIVSALYDFTRGIQNQSMLDSTTYLSDQVEAFVADVNEVLDAPSRKADRKALLERMRVLDEKRRYLDSTFFETIYNMARTMIEAYPLAGVLGTILAIASALHPETSASPESTATVGLILARFGDSIWSTAAGLFGAMILMFVNSCLETPFIKLSENRRHIREMVARAKRELAFKQNDQEGVA